MKVSASVKKICRNCKIIRRKGVVRVICTDPPSQATPRLIARVLEEKNGTYRWYQYSAE